MLHLIKRSRAALLGLSIATSGAGFCQVALADETGPLHYLNIQTINLQTRQAFVEAMRHNATESRNEPANIVFDVADIADDDPTLVLFESWRDPAGYQQHEASAHVAPVLGLVPAAFARPERKYLLQNVPGLPAPARKAIDNPAGTQNVVQLLSVKPDQREAFLKAAAASTQQARQQPGNLVYDLYQQRNNANAFVIYQRWASAQAYQAYSSLAAATAFGQAIEAAETGKPERLDLRDRISE